MAFIIGWILGGALITGLLSFLGYLLLGTGLLVAELCVIVKRIAIIAFRVLSWIAKHIWMLIKFVLSRHIKDNLQEEQIEYKRAFIVCPD